jgi:hypothetical protein
MAMDTEDIAEALELDYERNKTAVDMMKGRIDARLDALKLAPMQRLQAESMVKDELAAWQFEVMYGGAALPRTTENWRDGVDACVAKVEEGMAASLKLRAEMEASNIEAYAAREEQYQKEAARMDDDATINLEEYSEELAPNVVGHADMDKVAVARLGRNDAVATSALASCTGVSLYDAKTGVGAVMHVYQGKITIQHALAAMQSLDAGIKASDLQVTLMPGNAKGVNMSHLESLHEQLASAGITQVRDFSKEGRTSSTLLLRGDGVVISTTEAEKLAMAPTGLDSPDPRARSVSVEPPPPQLTAENLPPLPDTPEPDDLEVAGIMARSRSFSDISPPPRTPDHLPPLPDTPDPDDLEVASIMAGARSSPAILPPPRPDTPEPDLPDVADAPQVRARSASVREVLGMGKNKQGSPSEGLGAEGPSSGSRLTRSQSESQLGKRRM